MKFSTPLLISMLHCGRSRRLKETTTTQKGLAHQATNFPQQGPPLPNPLLQRRKGRRAAASVSLSSFGLSITRNSDWHFGQSQRDCALQPRVASLRAFHELENALVDFQGLTRFEFMVREQVQTEHEATLGSC